MTKSKVDVQVLKEVNNDYEAIDYSQDFVADVKDFTIAYANMLTHAPHMMSMAYISAGIVGLFASRIKTLDKQVKKAKEYAKNGEYSKAEQQIDYLSNNTECKAFELYWSTVAKLHNDYIKLCAQENTNPDMVYETVNSAETILENTLNYKVESDANKVKNLNEMLEFARKNII